MADLEELLNDARDKSAAEADASDVRDGLRALDVQHVELSRRRVELKKRIAQSTGMRGLLKRGGDPQADATELHRIETMLEQIARQQRDGQARLRELETQSHGAELARARLGAEMQRHTARLTPDDPVVKQLTELDERREALSRQRKSSAAAATLAGELIQWVDGAERADDGTDRVAISLRTASMKWEQVGSLLSGDAAAARAMLKDRLESFRTLDGSTSVPGVNELLALAAENQDLEHQIWLHRVRTALEDVLEGGTASAEDARTSLVKIDNDRLRLLVA